MGPGPRCPSARRRPRPGPPSSRPAAARSGSSTPAASPPSPPSLPSLTEHLEKWKQLLYEDPDKEFLLQGIKNGFKLQDENAPTSPPPKPHPPNYRSVRSKEFNRAVEDTIKTGLRDGLYKRLPNPPPITSPLSAVPKSSGGVRVIHDLSSPLGHCLNSYSSKDEVKFQTIEDAVNLLTPNCYLAKVDLKSAYRSVKIHPSSWPWTSLHWQFEDEKDPIFLRHASPFWCQTVPSHFPPYYSISTPCTC